MNILNMSQMISLKVISYYQTTYKIITLPFYFKNSCLSISDHKQKKGFPQGFPEFKSAMSRPRT